mgnify:CR=1 FL=1
MEKLKELWEKISLKFANTFSGPRLKTLLTVIGVFLAIGLAILTTFI